MFATALAPKGVDKNLLDSLVRLTYFLSRFPGAEQFARRGRFRPVLSLKAQAQASGFCPTPRVFIAAVAFCAHGTACTRAGRTFMQSSSGFDPEPLPLARGRNVFLFAVIIASPT
jgi:hypothetical protein